MKKILLYSAGLDSWLIDKVWKPTHKLFFRIGTRSNEREYQLIKHQIEAGLVDNVEIIDYTLSQFEQPYSNYYLPLRNLHLVLMAAHWADDETEICLGSVKGSVHKDNDSKFAKQATKLINYLFSEQGKQKVKVVVPFENTSKAELLRMYLEEGGDINKVWNETFSCYQPRDGHECYGCTSCLSKIAAFYFNGFGSFPTTVVSAFGERDFISFIKQAIEENSNKVEKDVLLMYTDLASKGN